MRLSKREGGRKDSHTVIFFMENYIKYLKYFNWDGLTTSVKVYKKEEIQKVG